MTDHDALAALLRELVLPEGLHPFADQFAARLTERGVLVTGDAGLRAAITRIVDEEWPEYVDHLVTGASPSLLLDYILRDLRAALTGDTPEARCSCPTECHFDCGGWVAIGDPCGCVHHMNETAARAALTGDTPEAQP